MDAKYIGYGFRVDGAGLYSQEEIPCDICGDNNHFFTGLEKEGEPDVMACYKCVDEVIKIQLK